MLTKNTLDELIHIKKASLFLLEVLAQMIRVPTFYFKVIRFLIFIVRHKRFVLHLYPKNLKSYKIYVKNKRSWILLESKPEFRNFIVMYRLIKNFEIYTFRM